jgi:hypothetical protein
MRRDVPDPVATSQLIKVILAAHDTSHGGFDMPEACFSTSMHKKIFSLEFALETQLESTSRESAPDGLSREGRHGIAACASLAQYF